MSTSANLDSTSVRIDPGDEAVVPLQIRNDSDIVEAYQLEVVGLPAAWTVVEPATVSLYPGNATTARVLFRPPRSAEVPAGEMPFGVRVVPTESPEYTVVPEGVVQVLPFTDTAAEITPRTSRGRRKGKHQIAVDNRGNVPLQVLLIGSDPNDALQFNLKREALTVDPGHAEFAPFAVRSKRRVWTGQPVTHPFQVTVTPTGGAPVGLDGTYLQEPIIPRWLLRAVLIAIAVAIALTALWFALLKPTIQSAARDAAAKPAQEAKDAAALAQGTAADAAKKAQDAKDIATGKKPGAAGAPDPNDPDGNGDPKTVTLTAPFSQPLSEDVTKGAKKSASFTVPAKSTLALKDVVLQNPQGDTGLLEILVNGKKQFEFAMENYRAEDFHFQALQLNAGDKLTMRATCEQPGKIPAGQPNACSPSLFFTGDLSTLKPQPKPKPTTKP